MAIARTRRSPWHSPFAVACAGLLLLGATLCYSQTTSPAASEVRAVTGFACSSPLEFETIEPAHIRVTVPPGMSLDGWLFRLQGVAGKTVQIDFTSEQSLAKWSTLNPVYADGAMALDDPALYAAAPSSGATTTAARVKVPNAAGQRWHFITNTKLLNKTTFTMMQTFDVDSVWVANRVPCTPGYNERFIRGLANNPLAKVVEIGRWQEGRPLLMVQIDGDGADEAALKSKDTLLIAGGEQATQPDGMWSSIGAIEFLLGDSAAAQRVRKRCRFLIIPMLDPDGTAHQAMELVNRFSFGSGLAAPAAYANFFRGWIDAGNRLDVVLEIHNVQSHECPHLSHAFIEGGVPRGTLAEAMNTAIVTRFKAANLLYAPHTQTNDWPARRFGGWLSEHYGPILIVYEINAQDPTRHLDLSELKGTGALFTEAAGDFLFSAAGTELSNVVDQVRAARERRRAGNPATQTARDALEFEEAVRSRANPQDTEPGGL